MSGRAEPAMPHGPWIFDDGVTTLVITYPAADSAAGPEAGPEAGPKAPAGA